MEPSRTEVLTFVGETRAQLYKNESGEIMISLKARKDLFTAIDSLIAGTSYRLVYDIT